VLIVLPASTSALLKRSTWNKKSNDLITQVI
jgi:hypothetical protein